jgi:hypothetical protein
MEFIGQYKTFGLASAPRGLLVLLLVLLIGR